MLCVSADVTDDAQCQAAVDKCVSAFGGIHIAVINAGISSITSATAGDIKELDRVFEVNLKAPVHLSRMLLPHLIAPGLKWAAVHRKPNTGELDGSASVGVTAGAGASLIFISSQTATQFALSPGHAAYVGSKMGITGFADGVWAEVRQDGVRVCVIYPSLVNTGMGASFSKEFGTLVDR